MRRWVRSNVLSDRMRWCLLETQEQVIRDWKILRLNMQLMKNTHTALVCHPCITMVEKTLFGNDQNQRQMWTIEDQTRVHLDLGHEPY